MSQENINVGNSPNDGTGDTLRQGAIKINNNFDELFTKTERISVDISVAGVTTLKVNEPVNTGVHGSRIAFAVDGGDEIISSISGAKVGDTVNALIIEVSGGTNNIIGFNVDGVRGVTITNERRVALGGSTSATYLLELPNDASDAGGRGRANSWDTYSDERIKSNRESLHYGIDTIMQLNPYNYFHHNSTYDEDGKLKILEDGEETIGLVAQEVAQVIPEIVSVPEDLSNDLCSLDYSKLTTVLIKAIQEQQTIIESLSARLDDANL